MSTQEKIALLKILATLHKRLVRTQAMVVALAEAVGEIHPAGHPAVEKLVKVHLKNLPQSLEQEVATYDQQIEWLHSGKKVH